MTSRNLDSVRPQIEILRMCKQKKAQLKELEDQARAAVEELMGDAELGLIEGEPVVWWKTHKRKSLDQKALKEEYPEAFEVCQKTSEIRRFEIVDDDD